MGAGQGFERTEGCGAVRMRFGLRSCFLNFCAPRSGGAHLQAGDQVNAQLPARSSSPLRTVPRFQNALRKPMPFTQRADERGNEPPTRRAREVACALLHT
jgi:hypothetical protein